VTRLETLTQTLRRTTASFLNSFARNDAHRWDVGFASGHWAFLDDMEQCPRHYVIAGMLKDDASRDLRVLDVGCGTGALVRHLPGNVSRYVGLDISAEAIRGCIGRIGVDGSRAFVSAAFEEYAPSEAFDVIVFNEMLYYYPIRRIPEVMARAKGFLEEGSGTIIVSIHERSPKRHHVWRRVRARLTPAQRVEATDPATGTSWRIERYQVR
jgi:2-polyprenyl-3-methyl-5-hydroxy-6-metoxy-1,4-benzoquinol methylase